MGAGETKAALRGLLELLEVVQVTGENCAAALELPVEDFEDALLVACAKAWKADYIVTRNEKDFVNSQVQAVAPGEILGRVGAG